MGPGPGQARTGRTAVAHAPRPTIASVGRGTADNSAHAPPDRRSAAAPFKLRPRAWHARGERLTGTHRLRTGRTRRPRPAVAARYRGEANACSTCPGRATNPTTRSGSRVGGRGPSIYPASPDPDRQQASRSSARRITCGFDVAGMLYPASTHRLRRRPIYPLMALTTLTTMIPTSARTEPIASSQSKRVR